MFSFIPNTEISRYGATFFCTVAMITKGVGKSCHPWTCAPHPKMPAIYQELIEVWQPARPSLVCCCYYY